MYNFNYLPASPAVARNILAMAKISGTRVDENIRDLASKDLLDATQLPITLTDAQQGVTQQVLDWRGRGVVLGQDALAMRSIALAVSSIRQAKTTVVICRPGYQRHWEAVLEDAGIDQPVVAYDGQKVDNGWILISARDFKHGFLKNHTVDQLIIEDQSHFDAPFGLDQAIQGSLSEIKSSLVLCNPLEVKSTYRPSDLYDRKSPIMVHVVSLLRHMWPNEEVANVIPGLDGSAGSYLRSRGYLSLAPADLLSLFGVFAALER